MKRIKVIWVEYALTELEDIYQYYIDNIGIVSGQRLINRIFDDTAKQLSKFPESGAIEQNLTGRKSQYRYLVIHNYKIIYSYNDHSVSIVRVFDCRLDPDKMSENIE